MQKIPLYKRENDEDVVAGYAMVDDDDFPRVAAYGQWRIHNHEYAVMKKTIAGQRRTVLMHRFVLGVEDSLIHVDHLDHDRRNNSKSNLRAGTQTQNNQNSSPLARTDSSSRHKGVGRYRGGWRAQGWADGKAVWLGRFENEDEAVAAYEEWRSNNGR